MSFSPAQGSAAPVYIQIADWLESRIRAGEFMIGAKLPSERLLSIDAGVARATAKNAYRELQRRGCVRIAPGSGAFVSALPERGESAASAAVLQVIARLRADGCSRGQIAELAQSCAWARLQKEERPRLAWVDDCPELMGATARQIEVECGFSVETLPLELVAARPERLTLEYYHTICTTVQHFEALNHYAREALHSIGATVDRVALSLTAETITALVGIAPGERVAVAHDSPAFFDCAKRYLSELGITSQPLSIPLEQALRASAADGVHCLILPPDKTYGDGLCGRVFNEAPERGVRVIPLAHTVDFGSIRHLNTKIRAV